MITPRFRENYGIKVIYPMGDFFVAEVARWAYYGMESAPNLLKFGKVVYYKRWHGNYIRIGVILPDGQLVRRIAPIGFRQGRWTAFIELRGNTLKYDKVVILGSTFEVEDLSYWPTDTLAFKLRDYPKYWVIMEENHWTAKVDWERMKVCRWYASKMKHQEISAETMADYCLIVLNEIEDDRIKSSLEKFMKNFYMLPRSKKEVEMHYHMDRYDVWVEDDNEWLVMDALRCF